MDFFFFSWWCITYYFLDDVRHFITKSVKYVKKNPLCIFKKQARNAGTVEKRIANSGGLTDGIDGIDGTDETEGTDGKIATDPMQSCYWQFYFMVF